MIVTKREKIIGISFFILGVITMYFYSRNELTANRTITAKITDNCINTLQSANSLINSCSEAYKTFGSCVLDLENCNMEESKKRLDELNHQKEQAEREIKNVTGEMSAIVNEMKKNQN